MNAVITGASRGIGKAIAIAFAKEGFNLALCSRNKHELEKAVKEIKKHFSKIEIISQVCDVSQKTQVRQFAEIIKYKWKKIDVLVNNAGIYQQGQVHNEDDGILEKMLGTNLYGAYYLTRELVDVMIKNKSGHIFNICSIASKVAYFNGGSYCISKHALYGFSKVLREEMKLYNIRVTSILPGATLTDSWRGTDLEAKRFIKPDDVASVVLNTYKLSEQTVVEEIILRPIKGDI